ncbi:MAG: hypothetical protein AAFP89_19310 [Bacteroidota bacterium]
MSFPNSETEIVKYIRNNSDAEILQKFQLDISSSFYRIITNWQNEIEDLIEEGNLYQALKKMKERVSDPEFPSLEKYRDKAIILISELNKLKDTEMIGIKDHKDTGLDQRSITTRITQLKSSIFSSLRKIGKTKKR